MIYIKINKAVKAELRKNNKNGVKWQFIKHRRSLQDTLSTNLHLFFKINFNQF